MSGNSRNSRGRQNNQNISLNNNNRNPRRKPSVQPSAEEIKQIQNDQRQSISENFSSSELTYGGSDKIIQIPLGIEFDRMWKRMIKKELKNQHMMRRFICSCLVTADKEVGDEVEGLVADLGSPEGMSRIREIVMFEMSVDAGLRSGVASFQRVILPFLALLTRKAISNCTLERFGQFFLVIVRLVNELLKRFKNASIEETMINIGEKLERLKNEWKDSFDNPTAELPSDPLATNDIQKQYFFLVLDKEFDRMNGMLHKKKIVRNVNHSREATSEKRYYDKIARDIDLVRIYDPPGELSENGPRHNNDFSEISKISIIPTTDEILCKREPYLPNISGNDKLHHLPRGAARLLDRQFRLLREDMLNAFRTIIADKNNGFYFRVAFTPPSTRMSTKSVTDRKMYWQKAKKLGYGNLVCLLWPNEDIHNYVGNSNSAISSKYSIYFGTIAHRDENILAKNQEFAEIGINFIDASLYTTAMKDISFRHKNKNKRDIGYRFLVESTDLLFESFKIILKTLQETEPSDVPFEKYLAPQFEYISNEPAFVEPPIYARAPGFRFNLSTLLYSHARNQDVYLNVNDRRSHNNVIRSLVSHSTLDATQAKALVSSLCREIALIEGPPGTGKSYIGVGIMRALLAPENRRATSIGPILTICYTNHALDNFLKDLLDVGIDNIVRIGSNSRSETFRQFNLEVICRNRQRQNKWLIGKAYHDLDGIINSALTFNKQLTNRSLDLEQSSVALYFDLNYPDHHRNLKHPEIPDFLLDNVNNGDEWKTANGKNKTKTTSIIEQWLNGDDLTAARKLKESLMNPSKKSKKEGKKEEKAETNRFMVLDDDATNEFMPLDNLFTEDPNTFLKNWIRTWQMPNTKRSLEELKFDCNVWRMSKEERIKLHDFWREEINSETIEELSDIQERYVKKKKEIEDVYNEGRRQVLLKSDVIGMTTTGAAKYHELIKSIEPKIIICEEAGKNYGLNISLFERLVHGNQSMRLERTQLLTQRRMRNEISDLIRKTLDFYSELEDHPCTNYPNVKGMQHNVFFMHHSNPEDSVKNEFAVQSHSNKFEVEMVVEMVK
ncbi:4956_t:CDS:10, partial [Diversispora eburnea]